VIPANVPPGFRLFYTTADFDGCVDDRIREFVRPAKLFSCHQVHGIRVEDRQSCLSGQAGLPVLHEPECDALWSDEKDSALAIKVADCLPISIIDPKKSIIANIHSGWRGAVQRITEITLDAVPCEARESFAFLGPSIRVCCFEVGEEVAAQFDPRYLDRTLGSKPHVDIPAVTTDVLRERGLENIVDTELCTRCPGSIFHSYRRDEKSGRNLAIVGQ